MPLFRKRKTIWQIKELEGYLNKISESQVPPDYDRSSLNQTHQSLDTLLRPNWEILHPICQDFIYSWFIEYKNVDEQKEELRLELNTVNNEMNVTRQRVTQKIDELNREVHNLSSNLMNAENALNQKMELIKELDNAIQNKSLGEDQLKSRMEQRVKGMSEKMVKQQEKFETSQIKIGNQFKSRVMELDEKKSVLEETVEKNKEKISELENENQQLKRKNHLLVNFQNRLAAIKSIIDSVSPELLKKEGK